MLNKNQSQLLSFVIKKHGEQKRKYTNKPYYTHCVDVAEIVSKYEDGCIEAALCHDLFEDTNCDFSELYKELLNIGYERNESYDICTNVTELTDKFTHKDYPYHNRKKRKELEAQRLASISYKSQSIKYADLINNTSSIVEYDKGFAKVYLVEKQRILELMDAGNKDLYELCLQTQKQAKKDLSHSIK